MRRTPLALVLLLLAAVAPAPAAAQEPPVLAAALAACGSGPEDAQRFAVFTGSMPARRGTVRMAMRFDLLERRAGSQRWRRVPAPKWGVWVRSKRHRSGFIYTKRVERLSQSTRYRAVVRFRWYAKGGKVQKTVKRRTPVCRQPDQRPNLRIAALTVGRPGADGQALLRVEVVNDGLTTAGRSSVEARAGGRQAAREIAPLAPGERVTVRLRVPGCAAPDEVRVRADAADQVAEAREGDNERVAACRAGGR